MFIQKIKNMKQTQNVAEQQGMLGYIIEQITPFLEKYPQYSGGLANIFLLALKVVKHKPQLELTVLKPIERLKLEIAISIKGNGAKVETALLELMMLNVMTASLGLTEIKSDTEVEEFRKYFESLKIKTANFEDFLRKEFSVPTRSEQHSSFASNMMGMFRAGMSREDFTLEIKIEIPRLKEAIQKYYKELGGNVTFDDARGCCFTYKIPGRSGFCTITNYSDSVMVTLC